MYFVLTLSRSGSSMLMQTLSQLGVDAGEPFGRVRYPDHDLFNPKGFYERNSATSIYFKGLQHEQFQDNILGQIDKAFKCDMKRFLNSIDKNALEILDTHVRAIFVTFRHPVEQALSYYHLRTGNSNHSKELFIFLCSFFKMYSYEFPRLANALTGELGQLRTRTILIDFHSSIQEPAEYVKNIKRFANLDSSQQQENLAIRNIDPGLYRYQSIGLSQEYYEWCDKLKALHVYETMKKAAIENTWNELALLFKGLDSGQQHY